DKEAEKVILSAISELDLNCKVVAEESGISGEDSAEYQIFVDPLDGSVNFSRGIPAYCVGVAVFKNMHPLIGIVFDPNAGELFIAESGKGVTLNGDAYKAPSHEGNQLVNLEWFGADNFDQITRSLKSNGIRARLAGSGVLAFLYGCIGRGDGAVLLQN